MNPLYLSSPSTRPSKLTSHLVERVPVNSYGGIYHVTSKRQIPFLNLPAGSDEMRQVALVAVCLGTFEKGAGGGCQDCGCGYGVVAESYLGF